MIDWHSHVLPEMDDGSKNVGESLSMLNLLREQGVTHVIATPHFYANHESVEEFLDRRDASYELLMQNKDSDTPCVICGAEVRYYPGILKMKELPRLAIGNTKLLLLEMPMTRWTELTVKELIDLSRMSGLVIVMAHVERYLSLQSRDTIERLRESGILMQVNASFFEGLLQKRKALKLLGNGMIQFIGSDCHNLNSRPPRIGFAYNLIEKKFGEEYVFQMNGFGYRSLGLKNN